MVIPTSRSAVASLPWMQCPVIDQDDIIPGLAFIYPLDQLIVARIRDNLHDVIGKNGIAYTIFNSGGQKVFLAVLSKKYRYFDVRIFNNYGNEIINVKRPFKWCANRVLVWAPPGNFLGSIREHCSCFSTYVVSDEAGKEILKIRAQGIFRCSFNLYLLPCGDHIGILRNKFPVLDVKNFGVTFPKETDVKNKIVLLGACFMIGFSKYSC